MKNSMIFMMVLFLVTNCLWSLNSDVFLIGDYANSTNPFVWDKAREAHYNTVMYPTYNVENIPSDLSALGQKELDVIITDEAGGTSGNLWLFSKSNYYRFQAEYPHIHDYNPQIYLKQRPDWFYSFNYQTDLILNNLIQFDSLSVICYPNETGYSVFDDLYNTENMAYPDWRLLDRFVFCEFPENTDKDSTNDINNDMYVRFRVKRENSSEGEICKVNVKMAFKDPENPGKTIISDIGPLLKSTNPEKYGTTLFDHNFQTSDFEVFEYKFKFDQLSFHLPDGRLVTLKINNGSRKVSYLSPILEYCNNGKLSIDYVEFEDTQHKLFAENQNSYLKRIESLLKNNKHIIGFNAYDEPSPIQFDAFQKASKLISDNFPGKFLHTAISPAYYKNEIDFNFDQFNTYNNILFFKSVTSTPIICPDFYLYDNHTGLYNTVDLKDPSHIQFKTDLITRGYRMAKRLSLQSSPNAQFIPVVQSFGQWNSKDKVWQSIMIPTPEQQKMLLYLPLCYGADGIWTFSLAWPTATESLNNSKDTNVKLITPIMRYEKKYQISLQSQYDAIKNTNQRIYRMAEIIKRNDLTWMEGNTLDSDKKGRFFNDINDISFRIYVQNPYDQHNPNAPEYFGQIEYGLYQDSHKDLFLMLVNRRTNKCVYKNEKLIPSDLGYDISKIFLPAPKQQISIRITNKAVKLFDCLTGDQYQRGKDGTYKIDLDAGEGVFIKIRALN